MPGFAAQSQILADELGLADAPVLRDPAGLDDDRSVDGGNLLSARDLAIAGRAYLADPELAAIAVAPGHEWMGGDGAPHSVTNLNAFLDAYPGAIGVKTGSTRRAGLTFVGAAERDGRTLLAVVLGSQNHYAHARELLDAGFLLAAVGERTGDTLPPVPTTLGSGSAPPTTSTTTTTSSTTTTSTTTTPTVDPAPDGEDAVRDAPAPAAVADTGDDDEGDPPVLAALAGGTALLAVLGAAVLARRRTSSGGVDRRPVKPRRRDRGRTGWTPPEPS
jgi:D-alanyl-D-alanine carboxypeptidase (penicillin-binding protein 5/6)